MPSIRISYSDLLKCLYYSADTFKERTGGEKRPKKRVKREGYFTDKSNVLMFYASKGTLDVAIVCVGYCAPRRNH